MLSNKIKELRTCENSRSENERELVELRQIKRKYEETLEKNKVKLE